MSREGFELYGSELQDIVSVIYFAKASRTLDSDYELESDSNLFRFNHIARRLRPALHGPSSPLPKRREKLLNCTGFPPLRCIYASLTKILLSHISRSTHVSPIASRIEEALAAARPALARTYRWITLQQSCGPGRRGNAVVGAGSRRRPA